MWSRWFLTFFLTCALAHAADPPTAPEDPAIALARILASKGTISPADLASVTAASSAARVSVLAAILEGKGVLSNTEVASLWSPPGRAAAGAAMAVVPALPPAAPPQQTAGIPVETKTNAAVSLYGTVLMNAFFNDAPGNIQDLPLFVSKAGSDPAGAHNFGMTARETRLGLRFNADHVAGARLSGNFEFDLFGGKTPLGNGMDMDIFRLRMAYGRLDWKHVAFEAGQDWAVFAPLNPTSFAMYAIPEFSASGNPWIRLPQVRTEIHCGASDANHWILQLAALDPNMGDYPTATFSTARQPAIGERGRMPALESRVAWTERAHDRDFTVGLSGHYDHGRNATTTAAVTAVAPVDSWGVALDYSLPLSKHFTLSGEAFEGRALGIFSVTSGEAIGAVGTAGAHGVESRGGWSQAQFNLTKQWQVNLAYGIEVPNASQLPVGNRWRNQTYMGNLMYKLNQNITIAWEYRRLLTDYRNQIFAAGRGDHVNLAIAYSF